MAESPTKKYGQAYMTIGILLVLISIGMLIYVLVKQWQTSAVL